MASIHPFRALRPEPDAAPNVSSVPYDVVTTEEARRLAAGNRLSFLHVTRSEIDLPDSVDPYADAVYEKARANLEALREWAPLRVESSPSLYLYTLRMGNHEQTGVAGCFSVDEYESDVIKKHERTRRDKEDDRTRHIVRLRAQTGVVFLTYKASAAVDEIAARVRQQKPLFDFGAGDGVHHTVWRAADVESKALVDAFRGIRELYIADGHHRAASAARARAELRGKSPQADTFIAVAFPDNQMQILPYHRLVKDLGGGRSADQFLDELRRALPVVEGEAQPRRRGEASMFLAGRWYWIDLSAARPADDTHASALDVARLQHRVLEPILGI